MTKHMLRARRLAVCTTAIIVTAVGGCTFLNGSDNPATVACSVPSTPPQGVDSQADAAPDGGGLRVVEKGFTQVNERRSEVSIGAVLENTSTQVAYRTRVTFGYVDAEQRSVAPPKARELDLEIPVILPGQRIPIGVSSYVVLETNGLRTATIAELRVALGAVRWVPKDTTFTDISAQLKTISRNNPTPVRGRYTYTVDSHYCRTLSPRGVGIIYRNSAGTIVGGSLYIDSDRQKCEPGTSDENAHAWTVPDDIDESRTEVYSYCDLAPPGQRTLPGAPFN